MKILSSLRIITATILLAFGARGQVIPIEQIEDATPRVPENVIREGRAAVVSYLLKAIKEVEIHFSGGSIIWPWIERWDRNELRERGYVTDGSFGELSEAIAVYPFNQEVVPLPNGEFQVIVNLIYRDSDGAVVLTGWGQLNIQREGPIGNLTVDQFEPDVFIPSSYEMIMPQGVNVAQWVSASSHLPIELNVGLGQDSTVRIESYMLGDGLVVVGEWGKAMLNLTAYDLTSNRIIAGEAVFALIGKLRSNDVHALRLPACPPGFTCVFSGAILNVEGVEFYRSERDLYGRFPLLSLSAPKGLNGVFDPTVPIWGTKERLRASRVVVEVLQSASPMPGIVEINWSDAKGGWVFDRFPPGKYNIRVSFDVLDWEHGGGKG